MVAMGTKEDLLRELDDTPAPMLEEVLRYLRYLKAHPHREEPWPLLVSESSLAKDWSRPEEDEAWAHL